MKKAVIAFIFLALIKTGYAASDNAAMQLKSDLSKIKSFSAQFDQHIIDAAKHSVSKSKGEVLIKRPGAFYWSGQEPDPILVIADGKTLWTYDIDLEQVTKQPITEGLNKTPAALLAGDVNELDRDFKISFSPESASEHHCIQAADLCFHLESKAEEKEFSDIYISMKQGIFIALTVHDQLGQEILTKFSDIKMNAPIDDAKFKFIPPKGVDIIDHHKGK